MKITAKFKGENGSLGFQTGKEYNLNFSIKIMPIAGCLFTKTERIVITPLPGQGGEICEYSSLETFLLNWGVKIGTYDFPMVGMVSGFDDIKNRYAYSKDIASNETAQSYAGAMDKAIENAAKKTTINDLFNRTSFDGTPYFINSAKKETQIPSDKTLDLAEGFTRMMGKVSGVPEHIIDAAIQAGRAEVTDKQTEEQLNNARNGNRLQNTIRIKVIKGSSTSRWFNQEKGKTICVCYIDNQGKAYRKLGGNNPELGTIEREFYTLDIDTAKSIRVKVVRIGELLGNEYDVAAIDRLNGVHKYYITATGPKILASHCAIISAQY